MTKPVSKVYIAAPFVRKEEAARVSALLVENGIEVTSRWITEHGPCKGEDCVQQARADIEDLDNATVFLLLNDPAFRVESQGGMHTEFGIALCRNKRMIVVGGAGNLFQQLPVVEHFEKVEDVIGVL